MSLRLLIFTLPEDHFTVSSLPKLLKPLCPCSHSANLEEVRTSQSSHFFTYTPICTCGNVFYLVAMRDCSCQHVTKPRLSPTCAFFPLLPTHAISPLSSASSNPPPCPQHIAIYNSHCKMKSSLDPMSPSTTIPFFLPFIAKF